MLVNYHLTETIAKNHLTARAKSLLHTNSLKQHKIEVPWCYSVGCNNDMKSVQKIQLDKIFK